MYVGCRSPSVLWSLDSGLWCSVFLNFWPFPVLWVSWRTPTFSYLDPPDSLLSTESEELVPFSPGLGPTLDSAFCSELLSASGSIYISRVPFVNFTPRSSRWTVTSFCARPLRYFWQSVHIRGWVSVRDEVMLKWGLAASLPTEMPMWQDFEVWIQQNMCMHVCRVQRKTNDVLKLSVGEWHHAALTDACVLPYITSSYRLLMCQELSSRKSCSVSTQWAEERLLFFW